MMFSVGLKTDIVTNVVATAVVRFLVEYLTFCKNCAPNRQRCYIIFVALLLYDHQ
jgi:hypothetical protein